MKINNIFRFKKISWKLTAFYAAMFSIILIILSVGIIYGIKYYLIRQAYIQVNNSSTITADQIKDKMNDEDKDIKGNKSKLADPELLSEATANSDIDIVIANEFGQVVNQSNNLGLDVTANLGETREITGANQFIVRNAAVQINSQTIAYLQVVLNLSADYSFLKVVEITIIIADIVGILLSVFAGFLVSKRLLKPIDNITTAAKEISITDLSGRIEVGDNDDELARLANTFNDMIDRLKVSFEKQNAFVSDASHELRTPIAVIRGYIDMIDRWGKNDKSILEEAIDAIQNETHNMEDMVEKLLFLARNDTGRLSINKEKFELYGLTEEIVTEYGLIYPGRTIISDIKKNSVICADRRLLKQALRALVDNGIKYSPEGEIRILSETGKNELSISVKDMGIGIPPDRINNIFERFYRVDSARERKTGGAGLGLSIVQTIVNAHKGRIQVKSEPGKGTTVTIVLPI